MVQPKAAAAQNQKTGAPKTGEKQLMSAKKYAKFLKYKDNRKARTAQQLAAVRPAAEAPAGSRSRSPPPLRRAADRSPTPGRPVQFQEPPNVLRFDPSTPVSQAARAPRMLPPTPPAQGRSPQPERGRSADRDRDRRPSRNDKGKDGKGAQKGKQRGKDVRPLAGRK